MAYRDTKRSLSQQEELMRSHFNKLAALLLGLVLLGGGAVAVDAATGPSPPGMSARVAAQATPDTTDPAPDSQSQNEDDADDAAEGDTGDDSAEDENAQPGTLTDGQDLLPQATITLEQAIATAQGAATGELGTVDLEQDGGTLVFEVNVGDQEVYVDATTGAVVSVGPAQQGNNENGDDETAVAPGTLAEGQDLLSQATITLEQAVAAAQGAASGTLGEVDLVQDGDKLVFTVDTGDQDVKVDAATGEVL
jgi:uncharacterized membrane protein YkoI